MIHATMRGRDRRESVKQGGEERRRDWDRTEQVIGALIEVHRHLGPGLLESAYEACICRELVLVTFNVCVLKHGIRRVWLADQTSSSPFLPVPLPDTDPRF